MGAEEARRAEAARRAEEERRREEAERRREEAERRREEARKAEEARRAEAARRAEENRRREEEESILGKIIEKTGRVCGELFDKLNISQNEIAEQFKRGNFPMGFSDNLLWQEIADNIKKLPTQFQEQEERITQITEEEAEISNTLKQLEEQKKNLEAKLKTTRATKIALQDQTRPWLKFKEKYEQVANFADNCAAVEKQLASALDKQLAVDPSAFTAEMKGDTPLSLVFNAFGMSASTIQKLHCSDGYEFLDHGFNLTCKNLDLPLSDQYDLTFLQQTLSNENFELLKQEHMEKCAVCDSNTPELLCYLIVEHKESLAKATANPNIDLTDVLDYVKRLNLTGRQFLGVSVSELRSSFPSERFAVINKIHRYFKNLHSKA